MQQSGLLLGKRHLVEDVCIGALLLAGALNVLSPDLCSSLPLPLRLALAYAWMLFLPGYCLLRSLWREKRAPDLCEIPVFSFAWSFIAITLLCIAAMELAWRSEIALWLLLVLSLLLFCFNLGSRAPRLIAEALGDELSAPVRGLGLCLLLAVAAVGVMLLHLGSPITVEEAIVVRKFAENPVITLDNVMHRPGVTATYLYGPLMFAQALVARLTGLDTLIVLMKSYSFFATQGLLVFYALIKALTLDRLAACFSLLVAIVLVTADPAAWSHEIGVLVPIPNRFGVAPGILLPLCFVFALHAIGRRGGKWTAGIPLLVLSMTLVHARDGIHFVMWLGLILVVSWFGGFRLNLRPVIFALAAIGVLFYLYHSRQQKKVPHVGLITSALKSQLADYVESNLGRPKELLLGSVPEVLDSPIGNYRFREQTRLFAIERAPARYPIAIALYALPFLVLFRSEVSFWLLASLTFPLLIVRVPLLNAGISWFAGSPDVGGFLSYLSIWCLTVFSLLLYPVCAAVSRSYGRLLEWAPLRQLSRLEGSWVLLAALVGAGEAARFAGRSSATLLASYPHSPLWWTIIMSGLLVVLAARTGRRPSMRFASEPNRFWLAVLLGAAIVVLMARSDSGRTLPGLLARSTPWTGPNPERPYRELSRFVRSRLPEEMVDFVRRNIPRLQVFYYDPADIDAIPKYLDQYVPHAELRLSTDIELRQKYVDGERFPVFGLTAGATDGAWEANSLRFLQEYDVAYLIVPGGYRQVLEGWLARVNTAAPVFSLLYEAGGFALYSISQAGLSQAIASQPKP